MKTTPASSSTGEPARNATAPGQRYTHTEGTKILLHCEENGDAPNYVKSIDTYKEEKRPIFRQMFPVRTEPVNYDAEKGEVFVVSDLHIASGRNSAGVYRGTENFFADDSFGRFLEYAHTVKKTRSGTLLINGDVFDFLRVTEFPGKMKKVRWSKRAKYALKLQPLPKAVQPTQTAVDDEYEKWKTELEKVGIVKTSEDLQKSIAGAETKYGLGTEGYKTIYKLMLIRQGHPAFFDALSRWMERGNKLLLVKGNHDLELYWRDVRNYLRLILAEGIYSHGSKGSLDQILKTIVLPNVTFIDDSVVIDGDFYVEHGHRYDKFTMVLGNPVLKKNQNELNIPFGSFFNRYLVNRIELYYPFFDKVRPSGNVLPILIRENFPLALKVLFQHIPFMIRMMFTNVRYVWFMFHSVFWFILFLVGPLLIPLLIHPEIVSVLTPQSSAAGDGTGILSTILDQSKNVGLLILSYVLSRIVGWFQLEEPSSLDTFARRRYAGTTYRLMTMGHTHNPGEYLLDQQCSFYNTGTWIPVIDNSSAEVREDRTYTFLHLIRDNNGKLQPSDGGPLQRWNDDAGRGERQILIERK